VRKRETLRLPHKRLRLPPRLLRTARCGLLGGLAAKAVSISTQLPPQAAAARSTLPAFAQAAVSTLSALPAGTAKAALSPGTQAALPLSALPAGTETTVSAISTVSALSAQPKAAVSPAALSAVSAAAGIPGLRVLFLSLQHGRPKRLCLREI
jgi:hypothetical protein